MLDFFHISISMGAKAAEISSKFNVYLLNTISERLFLKTIFYDILFFGKLSNKICLPKNVLTCVFLILCVLLCLMYLKHFINSLHGTSIANVAIPVVKVMVS